VATVLVCAAAAVHANESPVVTSPQGSAQHGANSATNAMPDTTEAGLALASARAALLQQDWAQAELLLERALMLRPESAEVLVELARLLGQRGRTAEAAAMLQGLLADPRTPAPQAQALRVLLAQLEEPASRASPPGPGGAPGASIALGAPGGVLGNRQGPRAESGPAASSAVRWRLEAMAGSSTNPLVATSASSITITLPDGTFQLPLEGRPSRAAYGAITAGAQTLSGHEFVLQAQQVDLPNQEPAYRAGALVPLMGGAAALLRTQRYGDGTMRHHADLQLVGRGSWLLQAGWYQEPSRLRQGPHGRLEWTAPSGRTTKAGAWLEGESNRDDGAPGYLGIGARAAFSPHPAWMWTFQWQFQRDTAGYSPLLESNARRILRTQQLGLEVALGENPASPWRIRAYDTRRISNLALFSWIDRGLQLVWRRAW
jgi:hypothetical protein